MKKFKNYKTGVIGIITLKLDGIQCIYKDGVWLSRKDKPLYNLPVMPEGIYEYFRTNWSCSVSDVRTQEGSLLSSEHLYRLDVIDERLIITGKTIEKAFNDVVESGGEGLVIHCGDALYKMKREDTEDVLVTGWIEGTGKFVGMMGALITPFGKVGTGFTNEERKSLTREFVTGKIIEVSFMEKTADNKLRHPRFKRLRLDK